MRKEDVLRHFNSQFGVSFPHRFEKPYIIKEIKSDDKVLDLGCGIGQTTLEFAEFLGNKGKITGIDFSPERIKRAMLLAKQSPHKEKVQFFVGDAESLDISDSSFSLIISEGVLLHITNKEAALKEMYRVLEPKGRIIISMAALKDGNSKGWDTDKTGVPVEWLIIADYENLFLKNGFSIDSRNDLSLQMKEILKKASGRYAEAFSRVPINWCYPLWKLINQKEKKK